MCDGRRLEFQGSSGQGSARLKGSDLDVSCCHLSATPAIPWTGKQDMGPFAESEQH
ncbi:hypothetical protein RB213_009119 [Colletotrichum asianum]